MAAAEQPAAKRLRTGEDAAAAGGAGAGGVDAISLEKFDAGSIADLTQLQQLVLALRSQVGALNVMVTTTKAETAAAVAEKAAAAAEKAAAVAEKEAAVAAKTAEQLGRLSDALAALCTAELKFGVAGSSPAGHNTSAASRGVPGIWEGLRYIIKYGWDPISHLEGEGLLERVTDAVAAAVWGRVSAVAAALMAAHLKGPTAQPLMAAALSKVTEALGGTDRGEWKEGVDLGVQVASASGGTDEHTVHVDHAWKAHPHRDFNVATVSLTLDVTAKLERNVMPVWQHCAMRLSMLLIHRFIDAPEAAASALKPWSYALATNGTKLVVVRASLLRCSNGTYEVVMQQSVQLPLWDTTPATLVRGLPAGLAVLAALMLARDDELGSPPTVPPTDLAFVEAPTAAAAIGDVAAWTAAMPLAGGAWSLLGTGRYADVHKCTVPGSRDYVVKAVRFPKPGVNCLREASALAVMGNVPVAPDAAPAVSRGCAFIPRLLGGAWRDGLLVALVLTPVGGTLHNVAGRVRGADRWAVIVHAIVAVLHALHHAHAARVAHRDVRPPNVIFSHAPRVRDDVPAAAAAAGGVGGGVGIPSVYLNDWGVAALEATNELATQDLGAAKELFRVVSIGRADAYSAPLTSADLTASCGGFPAGADAVSQLDAFLQATSVDAALTALTPLHTALQQQLRDLGWVEWREM